MMDSTPIDEVLSPEEMQGPPPQMMPSQMPPNQGAMMMQPQIAPQQDAPKKPPASQNPMNLTDEQMQALVVAVCTAIAISKPVQEKLAGTVPKFLNAQGNRSMVGLASTGLLAAIIFYFAKRYV